jgi:hypothetical protein
MKPLRYFIAPFVLFSMIGVATANASQAKSMVVTNSTSYTVNEFYASASDSSAWDTSNNILAGQTVGPGQQLTVNIPDGSENCDYDVMAVLYGAAQHAYQYRVNACRGDSWTINP